MYGEAYPAIGYQFDLNVFGEGGLGRPQRRKFEQTFVKDHVALCDSRRSLRRDAQTQPRIGHVDCPDHAWGGKASSALQRREDDAGRLVAIHLWLLLVLREFASLPNPIQYFGLVHGFRISADRKEIGRSG